MYVRTYICAFYRFRHHPAVVSVVHETEEKVMSGLTSPGFAADQLLLNQQQSLDH